MLLLEYNLIFSIAFSQKLGFNISVMTLKWNTMPNDDLARNHYNVLEEKYLFLGHSLSCLAEDRGEIYLFIFLPICNDTYMWTQFCIEPLQTDFDIWHYSILIYMMSTTQNALCLSVDIQICLSVDISVCNDIHAHLIFINRTENSVIPLSCFCLFNP